MSERPIAVGDLVVVVKPTLCCGSSKKIGKHFVVDNFYIGKLSGCASCGFERASAILAREASEFNGYTIERLKRIPPLSELEGVDTQEKLGEPA